MKALGLALIILVLFGSFSVFGLEDVSALFDEIEENAQAYEAGTLNYLQLKVLTEIAGNKISEQIGREEYEISIEDEDEEKHFEGVKAEALTEFLGEPNELTDWVWVVNEDRGMRVSEPIPRWEKTIFKGNKIKVVLEGHPNVIKLESGDYLPFYWVGFNTWFLQGEQIDMESAVDEIKTLVVNYYNTGEGKQELITKIISAERGFHEYMDQNREECLDIIDEIGEGPKTENKVYRREGSLYSGDNFDLRINMQECIDCEWSWMDTHFWVETQTKGFAFPEEWEEIDQKQYENMNINDLFDEIEIELLELKLMAVMYDHGQNPSFIDTFRTAKSKISAISRVLSDRVNHGNEISVEQRRQKMDEIFDSVVDNGRKEMIKQIEIKDKFFTDKQKKSHSWCEHRSEECGPSMICSDLQCVPDPAVLGPTGEFITGMAIGIEDFGFDCQVGEDCSTGKCRLGKCSTGQGESEACEDNFWCESEICDNGLCRGGGPASQFCGNGACDQEEETGGMYPCPQDCDVVEGCQTGCCIEEDPEAFCGGPCTICDYETGLCRPSTAPECGETSCGGGCCEQDNPGVYCSEMFGETWFCNYNTGDCELNQPDYEEQEDDEEFYPECGDNEYFEDGYCKPQEEWTCERYGCNPHQYCGKQGWCECEQGWQDCDGDWLNGCESQNECSPCQQDTDCASPRCSDDNWQIERFYCVEGDGWEEEIAGFEFGIGCGFSQTRVDSFAWFGGWGEKFDEINEEKQNYWENDDWCKQELKEALQARQELESSFKENFAEWYLTEVIEKSPGEFEHHMRALGGAYWSLVDANRRIAESMACLGEKEWTADPITVEWETPYGKIEIWEEFIETDYFGPPMQVLSPYGKFWIFPTKEVFKDVLREEFASGKMGDDDGGPSPQEREEIRQNPQAMSAIESIADRFGGDANFVFEIVDGEEYIASMVMEINEDVIMEMEPVLDYQGERDVTLKINYEFFYNMVSMMEQKAHTDSPPWDERPRIEDTVDGVIQGIAMFTGMIGGIATGDIVVEPASALPDLLLSFQIIMQMMMMGT